MSTAVQSIKVRPFDAALGADVCGVDMRKDLTPEAQARVRKAWADHLVLRFPEQPITDEEHIAFTMNFGAFQVPTLARLVEKGMTEVMPAGMQAPPKISVISNVIVDGKKIGGLGDGEAFWHTDSSYFDIPPAGSALRALEVPTDGTGSTFFLNMYAAYDELSAELKARFAEVTLIHSILRTSDGAPRKGFEDFVIANPDDIPGARHPLVRTHPVTRRKCLFLGRRLGAYVVGMSVAESDRFLDELWAHTLQDHFVWRQDWRVGDLVLWDNRCTMHRREAFTPSLRRIMHRTQIEGDRPY